MRDAQSDDAKTVIALARERFAEQLENAGMN